MEENTVSSQGMEFEILGLKIKWRATVFFGVMALSVLLNFYLTYKVMSIQDKLYERVITEIKEPLKNINQNINKSNQRLDNLEEDNKEVTKEGENE